jgi:polar amino acid transport system substrate-binding protein
VPKPALALWLLFSLCCAVAAPAHAASLEVIRARGELIAGVKADYEPFGFRDSSGALVGFDIDVTGGLAKAIGVPVRLVAVTSSNRLQKLASGEVDVLVATLGDTLDRRRLVRMIEPGYYGGGASVLLPAGSRIRNWADIKGQPLCAVQGALWNRLAASRLLADIRAFGSARDAEMALLDGACAGWLFDEAALQHRLASGDWPGYRLLPADFVAPWAIAVAEDGPLADLFEGTVADWMRNGRFSALEARWGLPPSTYVRQTESLWSRHDADGAWHCRRQDDGQWTADCRDLDLIEAQDLQGIGAAILSLRDRFGIDLTPFYEPFSRTMFLEALLTTVFLALSVVAGSLLAGAVGALMLQSRFAVLRLPTALVLLQLRMTPPLLQLYLVFFGIGGLLSAQGLTVGATAVAIIVLSLYAGSANATALSDASATIPSATPRRLRRVVALAFPSVMGSCINIVKATAMASAIAVGELVHASTAIIADYGNAGVMMNVLLACYVVVVLAVVYGFGLFERKVINR